MKLKKSEVVKNKVRKYDPNYLKYGFIETGPNDCPKPLCVLCSETLANQSMKPSFLIRHFKAKHPEHKEKNEDFFKRKADELKTQTTTMSQTFKITEKAMKTSYLISLRIARTRSPHTIAEKRILPSIEDVC